MRRHVLVQCDHGSEEIRVCEVIDQGDGLFALSFDKHWYQLGTIVMGHTTTDKGLTRREWKAASLENPTAFAAGNSKKAAVTRLLTRLGYVEVSDLATIPSLY